MNESVDIKGTNIFFFGGILSENSYFLCNRVSAGSSESEFLFAACRRVDWLAPGVLLLLLAQFIVTCKFVVLVLILRDENQGLLVHGAFGSRRTATG